MKKLLLSGVLIALFSCSRPDTVLQEQISGADSVAINFFKGDGTMDTVVAVKIVRDKKIVEELIQQVSAVTAEPVAKCGYDGSLHFFKHNVVAQDVDFRMNEPACMFFSFKQNGQMKATKLSGKAQQLLKNIRD